MISLMEKKRYIWYIPALFVSVFFMSKIIGGFTHNQEFIDIISLVSPLKGFAYSLTPLIGIFDFCAGLALLVNPLITKNIKIQKFLFVWVAFWPFIPASLRYFGGVGPFEIIEIVFISISALVAYILWDKYAVIN